MKYGKIDAAAHKVSIIEAEHWDDAKRMCGLVPLQTDIGTIHHEFGVGGCAIVVAEFGLFVPPDQQHYFAIGVRIFAGNAMLYSYDAEGVTIDFDYPDLKITWFNSGRDVENAILTGKVVRPRISRADVTLWEWPDPKPEALFSS